MFQKLIPPVTEERLKVAEDAMCCHANLTATRTFTLCYAELPDILKGNIKLAVSDISNQVRVALYSLYVEHVEHADF
jgi:hypothetical protein